MKMGLYVTKDEVAGETVSVVSQYKNEALAKRSWGASIANIVESGNPEKVPVQDLKMYKIGELDTETLIITPYCEFIASGAEFAILSTNKDTKEG